MSVGEIERELQTGLSPDLGQVVAVTRGLVELVGDHGLARLSVRAGGIRWEIQGAAPAPVRAVAGPGPTPTEQPADHEVVAPLVGVFHRSPGPGASPYVEVGDAVRPGQQLALVEAMRMVTEVAADRAGVLREIHPDDGEIVEFGQRLFTIEVA